MGQRALLSTSKGCVEVMMLGILRITMKLNLNQEHSKRYERGFSKKLRILTTWQIQLIRVFKLIHKKYECSVHSIKLSDKPTMT
jgi:hypothetical protein